MVITKIQIELGTEKIKIIQRKPRPVWSTHIKNFGKPIPILENTIPTALVTPAPKNMNLFNNQISKHYKGLTYNPRHKKKENISKKINRGAMNILIVQSSKK